MGVIWETNVWIFVLVTIVLAGGAGYMAGRSAAFTWSSPGLVVAYSAGLACAARFIHMALFGGTLLSGGYGSVIGTILGSITFGMIQVGLVLAGAPGHFFKTLTGAIVVAAVILNTDVARRLSRSRPLAGFRRSSAAADAAILGEAMPGRDGVDPITAESGEAYREEKR